MSRGIDNCNPGNIRRSSVRYKGERSPSSDAQFKQFEEMKWGYRAIFMLLFTYRKRHGLNTIEQMIARWAPPCENNTKTYVRYVCNTVGVGADEPIDTLDEQTMIPFASAISKIENGVQANQADVRAGWAEFIK